MPWLIGGGGCIRNDKYLSLSLFISLSLSLSHTHIKLFQLKECILEAQEINRTLKCLIQKKNLQVSLTTGVCASVKTEPKK